MINVYGLALKEIRNILSWQFLNPLKLGLFYFLIKIVSLKAFLSLGRKFIFLAPGKVKTMDERANTIRIHREKLTIQEQYNSLFSTNNTKSVRDTINVPRAGKQ